MMRTVKSSSLFILVALVVSWTLPWPVLAQSGGHLLLHDVDVQNVPGSPTYNVAVWLSLLDSGGNPIKDATEKDFSLTEDGKSVQIDELDTTSSEPIYVTFLLDTSGSMVGSNIEAAREATARFIARLRKSDRVAIVTFDETAVRRIDLTLDHEAAQQQAELVQATTGTGTCLYDAAYKTVQWATESAAGRQVIVLLTDGVDELSEGRPCSHHTADEVIEAAAGGDAPIPIYTIGLGNRVDAEVLGRIARDTGGRYLYSPEETQLEALFGRLSDELRFQYVLRYTSAAEPGEHALSLEVRHGSIRDKVSRSIELPAFPYILTFLSPEVGAEIQGETMLAVTVLGEGPPIARVQFLADGKSIGVDETPPYEIAWSPSGAEGGAVFLEAIAQSAQGTELARTGVNVAYEPQPTGVATPTPQELEQGAGQAGVQGTPIPTEYPEEAGEPAGLLSTSMAFLVGGSLLVVAIAIGVAIAARRKRREKERDERWRVVVQGESTEGHKADALDTAIDRTFDSFVPSEEALATLVVMQSDDPAMIGQRFEITSAVTKIGRKADNDIIFPKDSPVSRHHAVIEERAGGLFLSEFIRTDENGVAKHPTFGTFVNEQQVEDPVLLRDGDEIRLGKRVRLRFEAVRPLPDGDERTIDQSVMGDDDEKTVDSALA